MSTGFVLPGLPVHDRILPAPCAGKHMVPVAQWQCTGLWIQLLRVRAPSGTPNNNLGGQRAIYRKCPKLMGIFCLTGWRANWSEQSRPAGYGWLGASDRFHSLIWRAVSAPMFFTPASSLSDNA